jgi:EAL domain-containing protein (putative c-di-GMP-specific phosphodiesterase class I)
MTDEALGTRTHQRPASSPARPEDEGVTIFSVGTGPDQVAVVDPGGPTGLPPQLRLDLRRRFPSALENGELVLHYQPIIQLASGDLAGVEALVRWQHPELGLLGPGLFLPIVAEIHMLGQLTDWVARRAVHQHLAWAGEGRVLPHLAVNLTAADLSDDLVEGVRRSVIDAEMPNGFLGIELSEQAVIPDDPEVIARMHRLRSFGVRLALDDFGTGFSSLAHLRDLPVDTIKIDRRFITHVETEPADQAIVESTIAMAHRMGLQVVAEGVETPGQAGLLHTCGCDMGQGYFFSVPLAPDDMGAKLRRRDTAPPESADPPVST